MSEEKNETVMKMTLARKREIVEWIMKVAPVTSSFVILHEDVRDSLSKVDEFYPEMDEIENWFWHEDFFLCGCGHDLEARKKVYDILRWCSYAAQPTMRPNQPFEYGNESEIYVDLILKFLTSKGVVEHGMSVFGSYLTSKGKMLYDVLKEKFNTEKE